MGQLLNHDKANKKKVDDELKKDVKVQVKNQVERSEVVKDKKSTDDVPQITIPRNLRVDNHIANKTQALINMGVADDAKGLVEFLINHYIEGMSAGDQSRINKMVDMLEIKDYYSKQSKSL